MANLITGLFDTVSSAENAVDLLKQRGYTENEISIIMRNRDDAQEFAEHTGSSTMSGIGAGAAIGGTLGAVLGGLLAVGTIALPGIGLLVGGTAAAMLAGAGAGGLAGSLVGWLVNLGIDDEVAPYYERTLNEGGIVVAVASHDGDESPVRQILEGDSVAVAGRGIPTYIEPAYAARFGNAATPAAASGTPLGYAPAVREENPAASIPVPNLGVNTPNTTDLRNFTTQEGERAVVPPLSFENTPGAGTMPKAYDSTVYDSQTTMTHASPEVQRTVNSVNAEDRSAERTAETRERDAERDAHDDGVLDHLRTAVVNTADNTQTALENQADKIGTGISSTADRASHL